MTVAALISANAHRWSVMHPTPALVPTLDLFASRLIAAKARYQDVSTEVPVPWWIIAVIHLREASQSWTAGLAQGDPWDEVSIHVPRGIGPFDSWEDAAVYALSKCPPLAAKWTDWTTGGALTLLEEYNGLGYAARGVPSPYVWASTDQYHSGKYVADGLYDPNAVDHQLGCAALIARMQVIDPTIQFAPQPEPVTT